MSKNVTFDEAWEKLNQLVVDIEDDSIPLDELAVKVKEAKKLIKYCDSKLKQIELDLVDTESDM